MRGLPFPAICNVSNGDFTIELRPKPPKGEPIPIEDVSRRASIPKENFLKSPFPNPSNPNTPITFGLNEPAHISLVVYDVAGSVVKVLYRDASLAAGEYMEIWDGRNDTESHSGTRTFQTVMRRVIRRPQTSSRLVASATDNRVSNPGTL